MERTGEPIGWRLETAGRAGAAALIVLWGWLFFGFQDPVDPYRNGSWAQESIAVLAGLGFAAGAVAPGAAGLAGAAAGAAAAIAIQLFVLTGQASWTPAVTSSVGGDAWLPSVAGALATGLLAVAAGCAVGTAVILARFRRPSDPPPWAAGVIVASAVVVVASIAAVGALLVDASSSAYVVASDEPTVVVSYRDGAVSVTPATVPAGRATLVGPEPTAAGPFLAITYALSDEERAAIAGGRLTGAIMSGVSGRTRTDLPPGVLAAVAMDPRWVPPADWDGSRPILGSATFVVTPADALAGKARGDAGRSQVAGLLAALATQATAMFALVAWAAARRRRPPHVPGAGIPVGVPGMVAAVSTFVLGGLALLAVDLAHNPF